MGTFEKNFTVSDIKPFIGSKNYQQSLDFYKALGWKLKFDTGDIAELELGNHRFFLQRYYQRQWCQNSMLHISVDNTRAWYAHITEVLEANSYGAARVAEPAIQDYGSLVTFVWDPVGVLLHFAEEIESSG